MSNLLTFERKKKKKKKITAPLRVIKQQLILQLGETPQCSIISIRMISSRDSREIAHPHLYFCFAERGGESDTCSTGGTAVLLSEIESARGVEASIGRPPVHDLRMLSVC